MLTTVPAHPRLITRHRHNHGILLAAVRATHPIVCTTDEVERNTRILYETDPDGPTTLVALLCHTLTRWLTRTRTNTHRSTTVGTVCESTTLHRHDQSLASTKIVEYSRGTHIIRGSSM